jgi:hypothetical protein
MKTKEEFLQEAYGYKFEEEDFLNPAIAITLNAMEKYAQEVVNNLHKADVIPSVCDGCIHNECKNTWIEPCHSCSNGNNKQTEI